MNWKKIATFILLLILSLFILSLVAAIGGYGLSSPIFLIFSIAYICILFWTVNDYSSQKLFLIIVVVVVYIIISIVPLLTCDQRGPPGPLSALGNLKECTCIGIKVQGPFRGFGAGASTECIGIPSNYKCYTWTGELGVNQTKIETPCR